jgi:translocation and assembly module TamB
LGLDGRTLQLERVAFSADGDAGGLRAAVDLALGGGAGSAHLGFESRAPATLTLPKQGELSLQCSDLNLALLGPFLPQGLKLDGRLAGVGTGRLNPGRQLDLKGNLALTQGLFAWHDADQDFDARFLKAELAYAWHGLGTSGKLRLAGDVEATGEYQAHGERLTLERFALRLDADERGTRAGLNLTLPGGAAVRGSLSSSAQLGAGVPETGDFALEWGGIDPALLKSWLPGALNLKGQLAGQAKGRLLPGKRLEASGAAEFSQGEAGWQGTNGELKANLRSASLSFDWRGETLTGNLALSLAQYGSLQGRLLLPVPARLPVAAAPAGPLQGYLTGRVQELGLIASLFPGVVQESHGDLDLDLHLAGTWQAPVMQGGLTLAKAGAYLPSAGIRVSDVTLKARLTREEVLIEGFRAVSGKGHLEGNAAFRLKGWQVESYRATLNGDSFQTVYLPELQLFTSPKLVLEGEGKRVTINGEVRVPEMLISGPPTRGVVQSSRDVVLEGVPESEQHPAFPLQVEGRIRLILGDKVQVKAEGIDTRLGGEMELALNGIDNITSRGEIYVVKGRYKAYGVDLEIVRGRLYYVDGPLGKPTLDILALRTIADVKVGVTVAGPLGTQVVKLYSEPAMPDVDIMAYIVLGHPLGSGSGDQASLVAGAASSLLSFGQSESLQDQIKDRLGLNVLGLSTVDQTSAGRMGYKEIAVTPPGMAPKTISTGESLLTVGKYLTPKIYLSYGRSLVTGGNLFQLRYDIFRHVQIETQSGSESGADIYYKLEFN